ncbi:hypothetical protein ACNPQM_37785 [Streptomyces sp. NPDC056231]
MRKGPVLILAAIVALVWLSNYTGFPKDGVSSPGVARQYSGTLGACV